MTDFLDYPDLAAASLGGRVIYANDDFFAPKENLLKAERPIFIDDKYTERGKWMDGWESRRRRGPGHDHCIVRLGASGRVRGVIVDTTHFRGNHPAACSLEGCWADGNPTPTEVESAEWIEVLPRVDLAGHSENRFFVHAACCFTHVRFHIYPDGGVARLRIHGEPMAPWSSRLTGGWMDLAAVHNGGRVIACSDMFFGPRHNLIMPNPPKNMGDGWETRRRRGPGNDWCVVSLGAPGRIRRMVVDTSHFKGNFPDRCSVEGTSMTLDEGSDLGDVDWKPVLAETKLQADTVHTFSSEILAHQDLRALRLSVYPDGGVARLRVYGEVAGAARLEQGLAWLNALPGGAAGSTLRACCGSEVWCERMAASRPWESTVALFDDADRIWASLGTDDWLQAFRVHPRIGERPAASADRRHASWSSGEQASTHEAAGSVREKLREANRAYDQKFGHIFILCATGKTPEEMLEALRERMDNDAATELHVAAEEQRKITELRLRKLLTS